MSTKQLREKLFLEIDKTDNEYLLEEVYRLLQIEMAEIEVFRLNDTQNQVH